MRTMQIKPPSKRTLKNLLVTAIIDVNLSKEGRAKNANSIYNSRRTNGKTTA
jgi:hypothetical protein